AWRHVDVNGPSGAPNSCRLPTEPTACLFAHLSRGECSWPLDRNRCDCRSTNRLGAAGSLETHLRYSKGDNQMLYQDTLTGTLHEVPDSQVGWGFAEDPYAIGEAYDGLGYPLGWGFKSLKGLIKRVAPIAMSMSPYGQIIRKRFPFVLTC